MEETHPQTDPLSVPAPGQDASELRDIARRTISDSVFTNLFRIPRYTLELYKVLHPEDSGVTEENIRIVTLQNILLNQIYNDLGFQVGDRVLILAEAQSTWNDNILVRGLFYLAKTLQTHIIDTGQSVYKSSRVRIPVPELYVIYTGESRASLPQTMSLAGTFFAGQKTGLDLTANIISRGDRSNVLGQYMAFASLCRSHFRLRGRNRQAVIELIRHCQDHDILKEYLLSREKEVIDIMLTLFNQEEALRQFITAERAEVRAKMRAEVRAEVRAEERAEERAKLNHRNALIMLRTPTPPELISSVTGYSVDQLRQIAAENHMACSF